MSVIRERWVKKARSSHKCTYCSKWIAKGARCFYFVLNTAELGGFARGWECETCASRLGRKDMAA